MVLRKDSSTNFPMFKFESHWSKLAEYLYGPDLKNHQDFKNILFSVGDNTGNSEDRTEYEVVTLKTQSFNPSTVHMTSPVTSPAASLISAHMAFSITAPNLNSFNALFLLLLLMEI